jgi:parallel beta-helix repeat protein
MLTVLLYCLLAVAACLPGLARAANTHGTTSESIERGYWFGEMIDPYVVSGCLTSGQSGPLTFTPFACAAYVRGAGGELVYVQQDAQSLTLGAADGTHWLAVCRDTSSPVTDWTRRAGTHYVHRALAATPPDPPGCQVVEQFTVTAGAVSAVFDRRRPASWARHRTHDVTDRLYGARGDDEIDDTAAINAALGAAAARGGAVVFLPAGTYHISGSLGVGSYTTLVGTGAHSIIQMAPGMTTRAIVGRSGTGEHDIRLSNLRISGNRATPPGAFSSWRNAWATSQPYAAGAYTYTLAGLGNVYVNVTTACTTAASGSGPSGTGTNIADGSCVWNYVEPMWTAGADALFFTRCNNITVEALTVHGHRNSGIIFEFCEHVSVSQSHFYDNNKSSIYCSGCERATIVGNTVHHDYEGVSVANCWYCTVAHNVGRQQTQATITAGRDTRFSSFTGNMGEMFYVAPESITGYLHGQTYPGAAGDYLYGLNHSTLTGNTLTGVYLQRSDNNVLSSNVIRPYSAALFETADTTQRPIPGFYVHGSVGNTFEANRIYNGGTVAAPWAFHNDRMEDAETGTAEGYVESSHNRYLNNYILDDRASGSRLGFYIATTSANIVMRGNNVSLAPNNSLPEHFVSYLLESLTEFSDNVKNNTERLLTTGGPPTSSVRNRGDIWLTQYGTGAQDIPTMVVKNVSEAYVHNQLVNVTLFKAGATSWDPPIMGHGFSAAATVTIPGLVVGDYCFCTFDLLTVDNAALTCTPQSAGLAHCTLTNTSGANLDLGLGTLKAFMFRIN